MTKLYSRETQCDGKRRYSKWDVKMSLRRIRANGATHLNYYKCPWYETWHLGHKVDYEVQAVEANG